jgi:hypothetical protein
MQEDIPEQPAATPDGNLHSRHLPPLQGVRRYLTEDQIPFIDREVDSDSAHMAELMKIFEEMGVPKWNGGAFGHYRWPGQTPGFQQG